MLPTTENATKDLPTYMPDTLLQDFFAKDYATLHLQQGIT